MASLQIILAGSFVAVACALLGSYLILRKMAMIGDAISHAVLPGIVIAFLISGSRDTGWMLLGAGFVGILTTFLIEFLHQKAKLQTDASIGVVFTSLFALGVILISAYAGQVDLDQECVLYGEIAYVPFDIWVTDSGTVLGPRILIITGIALLLVIIFILLGYKELFITTFDPAFAAATGINAVLWHYLLMGAVSFTTVASFEAVGAILVVALLIAPPATAYLLTDNFKKMLLIAAGFGILSSISGYYLASWADGSIAGAMATMAGVFFGITFIFAPEHGILAKRGAQGAGRRALSAEG